MRDSKKLTALVLAVCLALLCAACGGDKAPAETPAPTPEATAAPTPTPAPTPEPTPAPTPEPAVGDEPVTGAPEGSVLFCMEGVKVTSAGPGDDGGLPIIWVDVENSGDKDLWLGVTDGSVNGFMADPYLIHFYTDENGGPSVDYGFGQTAPAGQTVRYALGYSSGSANGIDLTTLGEMTFYFTLTEDEYGWPYYTSAPITVATGEAVPDVDIAALGTTVIDNDKLLLVLGEQDYDGFFGPEVAVYMENRTDGFLGLIADTAEADGVSCDYVYGTVYAAPHKRAAGFVCFDGEVAALRGFENLTLNYSLYEAETRDDLNSAGGTGLDPVSVTYPPQVWGEFENGGYSMEITPKYNALVTVETPKNDPDGILFTVSETASMEAGDHEGAGWLFSIAKISADKLHEALCRDMSGAEVFAKDSEGNYFMYCHPTDVRFERATVEEMQRDSEQWSMLCQWADGMKDAFLNANGLDNESYGNSELDMYIARAAWDKDSKATISYLEPYGEVSLAGVDGTAYADFLLHAYYWEDDDGQLTAPDGEYMVLNLPEEGARIDFFFGDPTVARLTRDGTERLYQAMWWYDNSISYTEAVHGWYYAAAEKAGLKEPDATLDAFLGGWAEEIAGRATVTIEKSIAPGKVNISVRWPDSMSVCHFWTLTARSEEGALFYENGEWEVVEYDEDGSSWTTDSGWEETGRFELADGKLVWHDDARPANGEAVFIRAN